MSGETDQRHTRYWRANMRLIAVLLGIWGLVSLVFGILLEETLNKIQFFGLPLGFWIAQQGAMYVFVVLIFIYAWRMDKLDQKYHADKSGS